jgi:hypothetical protein
MLCRLDVLQICKLMCRCGNDLKVNLVTLLSELPARNAFNPQYQYRSPVFALAITFM